MKKQKIHVTSQQHMKDDWHIIRMEKEDMTEVLKDIIENIDQLTTNKKIITLPGIFGKEYQEGFVTLWLAYLFDPSINGFGIAPLNALLSHVNAPLIDEEEDVSIALEYTFKDSGRRIDLLITTNNLVIGIENKIQSGEHESQTKDYWDSMQALCNNTNGENKTVYGIYLKPTWNTSTPSDKFMVVTYEQLLNALRTIKYDHSRDHRKNFFFYEFILYAEEILMTGNDTGFPTMGDDAKIYMKNRETIETARNNLDTYIKELGSWLENQFSEIAPEFIVDSPKSTYWQIRENNAWKNLNFHYELFWPNTRKKSIAELAENDQDVFLCMHLESAKDEVKKQFREVRKNAFNNEERISVDFSTKEKAIDSIRKIIEVLRSENFQAQARIADNCIRILNKQTE